MAVCKLKKGDRIYECRYHESTLTELITEPEILVQGDDSHYWHWKAKIVETNFCNMIPGEIIEFGITEEAPTYGPHLFRKDLYKYGYEAAEPVLPPFDTDKEGAHSAHSIKLYSIHDDVEILGHVFHGLKDIMLYCELSLYKDYEYGKASVLEPKKSCEVHVVKMWAPYPCFDDSDYEFEDRTYQNYIFRNRPINQEDMRTLSELPNMGNECRISKETPYDMRPMIYYRGDNEVMIVAI